MIHILPTKPKPPTSALLSILLFCLFFCFSCSNTLAPLGTVENVDLEKYTGKWYEIASFPQRFQEGCHCTTADYTVSEKGFIIVKNRCNKDAVDGAENYIEGKAFVKKNTGNAKLKVQFFWPFRGKYWIIDLAEDYSYAVVGHPNRKYLWVLSRSPIMEDTVYSSISNRLKAKDFDVSKLRRTQHQGCN